MRGHNTGFHGKYMRGHIACFMGKLKLPRIIFGNLPDVE